MDANMQERLEQLNKDSDEARVRCDKHTDADRAKLVEGYDKACDSCIYMGPTEDALNRNGSPEEKATFADKSKSLWDRLRPYLLRDSIASPFVYDFRRGKISAAIYYVNTGANDFNQVDPKSEFVPSIMLALHFNDPRDCKQESEKEDCIQKANDFVYIYKKLLENHPDGLNDAMIDAYEAKHPEQKIRETLNKIAEYAKQPENERFIETPKQEPIQEKPGFLSRLFGRGARQ